MLEIRELCKTYKPKKGVPVKAIDHVSLTFPKTGMVFLLGKSGSGKSTLLNLLGGLDQYDSGEIIIKGVSSRNFKQKHFDSYRNTYVGFIFQEYNVLEEFTVGANIALALELQGKKASDEAISAILHEVDLDSYGNRKPNELSGGQKQRVAIARALVKNPQIIMADEPTGALDSNTGKQVFDTLKKLSEKKLVLVVSHDRDFAELYADRIIELADGRVISDLEYSAAQDEEKAEGLVYSENTVAIPQGYHLTEEDREAINAYMDSLSTGGVSLIGTANSARRKKSHPTDQTMITRENGSDFHLIRSRLPLKNAFKIGASGLGHKKVRLVVTILLSCIAFGLFGLADTFGAYDHIKTCTQSIIDSDISYASVEKSMKVGSGENAYYRSGSYHISTDELADIEKNTGVAMNGVYLPLGWLLNFNKQYDNSVKFSETEYHIYAADLNGFAEISEKSLAEMGYEVLAGKLPDGTKNEIALSKYACETFVKGKYNNGKDLDAKGEAVYQSIASCEDMIGKTLNLSGTDYTVTAIIDTHFDLSRYQGLTVLKENESSADQLLNYALYSELNSIRNYSLMKVAMVGEGFVDALSARMPDIKETTKGWLYFYANNADCTPSFAPMYAGEPADLKNQEIIWLDGEKTSLGEKELVVSTDLLSYGGKDSMPATTEETDEDRIGNIKKIVSQIPDLCFNGSLYDSDYSRNAVSGYRIVGIIDSQKYPELSSTLLVSAETKKDYTTADDGIFSYSVGAMPAERGEIEKLVSYCYSEENEIRYEMMNSVTFELDSIHSILKELSNVFFYIGIGFAVFAAIMLANFISTSISYKKQEIGILRAIGARGNDVFRIFFSESFLIAMINFILSAAGVGIATAIINSVLRTETGILITVLSFGIRQIALLLLISIVIAALASFIPVKKIASKRPIDAIRNR